MPWAQTNVRGWSWAAHGILSNDTKNGQNTSVGFFLEMENEKKE